MCMGACVVPIVMHKGGVAMMWGGLLECKASSNQASYCYLADLMCTYWNHVVVGLCFRVV